MTPTTRKVDLNDDRITENTRPATRSISIPTCAGEDDRTHPKNVIFLTCDCVRVLPPIARLFARASRCTTSSAVHVEDRGDGDRPGH